MQDVDLGGGAYGIAQALAILDAAPVDPDGDVLPQAPLLVGDVEAQTRPALFEIGDDLPERASRDVEVVRQRGEEALEVGREHGPGHGPTIPTEPGLPRLLPAPAAPPGAAGAVRRWAYALGVVRPRVAVSACLLGEAVRHDGAHKRSAALLERLAPHVDLIAVCPEVELGLGVPRAPIQLEPPPGGVGPLRLVAPGTRRDLTEAMAAYAEARVAALGALHLSGYVLKSRSPSCGARGVAVAGAAYTAPGAFAAVLQRRLPDLPVVEETGLEDPALCERFLAAVRRHAARRSPPGR